MKKINAQYEPRARGVNKNISITARYIGWRTAAQGPVVMTFCPFSTSMIREAYLFSLRTRKNSRYPEKTMTSAAITSARGTSDH
ncbi:MAG: hypothetical protein OIN88_11370 [Candidatus Methanoperedens sp.]|nr:hypothetical protein [Candidatus Methanoperedens sp.]